MGILRITTAGSFQAKDQTFSAQESGHAVAVDNAIQFLQNLKGTAVEQDKLLRKAGHEPDDSFKEADRRGILADKQEGGT